MGPINITISGMCWIGTSSSRDRYVFKVYAIASTGKWDLTPAKQVFHVKRR